jgi:tetratricopeptide (TPR) repeat protein
MNCLALLVAACGVAGAVHYAKLAQLAEGTAAKMDAAAPGLMYLIVGLGLAGLMAKRPAVAASPGTAAGPLSNLPAVFEAAEGNGSSEATAAPVAVDPWSQINPVLEQLIESVDALSRRVHERPVAPPTVAAAPPMPSPVMSTGPMVPAQFAPRMIELLDEIRELSMMSEAQKRARFLQHSHRQKTLMVRQARNHVGAGQFAEAEALIEQCIAAYASDDDVEFVRHQLNEARATAAATAVDNASHQVEDLMALSRWDEAIALVDGLVSNHPDHADAQALRDRVARERDLSRNAACQRLFDEIRKDIDHRDWRKALAGSQQLLEKFGDLPRAEKVRGTVRTIQDNAEIQERQEVEARIQELIRGKRFTDAVELSEELIARFPGSPQADKLRDLLPKLREHAVTHEAGDLIDRA